MKPSESDPYYYLDSKWTDPSRIKRERQKARDLKKTHWWRQILQKGECGYCHQNVGSKNLTMDHIVPLARGGASTKGNLKPSCLDCNQRKKLTTPAEDLMNQLSNSNVEIKAEE